MRYILDFDRVLFDTDSFSQRLKLEGLGEMERGRQLVDMVEEKGIKWSEYVFDEVFAFLSEHGDESVILSSFVSRVRGDNDATEAELEFFQTEKITRSGVAKPVSKVVVLAEEKLSELGKLFQPGAVFIDDEFKHIQAAQKIGYRVVWKRTKHNEMLPVSDDIASVNSFEEFVALMKTWNQNQ